MRLATLPHDEVLAFERGGRSLEQRRHRQFADHRFAGTEWFSVHEALLAHVAELARRSRRSVDGVRALGAAPRRAARFVITERSASTLELAGFD